MDPDKALGSSLGLDITVAPGGKQATHTSLFSTAIASSFPLFLQHVNQSPSLSLPFLRHMFAHQNGAYPSSTLRPV